MLRSPISNRHPLPGETAVSPPAGGSQPLYAALYNGGDSWRLLRADLLRSPVRRRRVVLQLDSTEEPHWWRHLRRRRILGAGVSSWRDHRAGEGRRATLRMEEETKTSSATVLSMRGKDGAGAVAQLMAGTQILSPEGEASKDENALLFWDNWSSDGNEGRWRKRIKEDIGAAMQSLQLRALMPISTATAIHHSIVSPERDAPS